MTSRASLSVVAVLASLMIACSGRGCGSATESNVSTRPVGQTAQSAPPPFSKDELGRHQMSSAAMMEGVQQAQVSLGEALKGTPDTLAPSDVVARLTLTFDALRRVSAGLPRDTFDIGAVVEPAGRDADKLFAWVREETRLVPYAGTLRGAQGVLMDRLGNSLDRSLLLVRLLEDAGHHARLARTKLARTQADSLLQALRSEPARQPATLADNAGAVVDSFIEEYAKRFQTPAEALRERLKALRTSADAAGRELSRRAYLQVATLREVPGVPGPGSNSDDSATLEALADHWWVQLDRGGRWIDLDATGMISSADALPAGAVTTLRPEAIPDELRHKLRVRVLVECACGGRLTEQPVLDHTLNLNEHPFDPIVIQQAPTTGLSTSNLNAWPTIRNWLLEQDEWMPALTIGTTVVMQSAFTVSGEVRPPGTQGSAASHGGLLDAFGGGGQSPAGTGQLTAEVLVFDLTVPGQRIRHERRTIVDWIGSQARAEFAANVAPESAVQQVRIDLLNSTEILPLAAEPSPEFVAELTANALLKNSVGLLASAQAPTSARLPAQTEDSSAPFPGSLFELALVRRHWNPDRGLTYLREANVLTRHQGFRDGKDGVDPWSAFDIVYNRVGVKPGVDTVTAFDLRMKQGVLDTNAEIMVAARHGTVTNVSEIMATDSGREWVLQRDPGSQSANGASTATIRIEPASNGAGDSAAGYWLLDPTDGSVLGMTSIGWGGVSVGNQGMTGFAVRNAGAIRAIGIIFKYVSNIACAAGAVRQMLNADPRTSPAFVMGRGTLKMTGCALSGIYGSLGIAQGGALGSLYSRMSDVFSIAFTISSWI
jgi:hypothetical protein